MSVESLLGFEDFRHRFKDDMESFYYVVLYASIHWLPHENPDDVKTEVARFFDEYKERRGKAHGGIAKSSNFTSGRFYDLWGFQNDALKIWLEGVRKMQWKNWDDEQPKWTPKGLNDLWKIADEGDLPIDDRVEHLLPQATKDARKTKTSASDAIQKNRCVALPGSGSRSADAVSRSSSKRSVEEVGFEERSGSSKRFCRSGCVPILRDDRLRRSC